MQPDKFHIFSNCQQVETIQGFKAGLKMLKIEVHLEYGVVRNLDFTLQTFLREIVMGFVFVFLDVVVEASFSNT